MLFRSGAYAKDIGCNLVFAISFWTNSITSSNSLSPVCSLPKLTYLYLDMLAPFETTNLADDEQEEIIIGNTDNNSTSENMENRVRIK